MDQLFRMWSALYMITPEILTELLSLAARTEGILKALQHWTYSDLVMAVLDALADLLLRVGHDVDTITSFLTLMALVPVCPPGSTLFGTISAIQVRAHLAWQQGAASIEEVPAKRVQVSFGNRRAQLLTQGALKQFRNLSNNSE